MKTKRFSIEISDEAEIDLDKSYEYYYKDSPKVTDAFFKRIDLSLKKVKQNPYSFPIAHENVRKYIVKKVPICDLLSDY